ncbi:hypothetical protein ABW16_03640 [Mycolicibacter heraklionensis]|uniref:Uncharacterized protein n=1 Tax=Mycolicibacter heraklionensis TaxID=512402 RepID=A0A9X7WLB4_9MYCO|nr:hypothetical protein [Mycolicibacter heraklionensis]KLO30824.1 hypothetical protein ABW16_03640 [Mycolicibacter heraklionensis]QZA09747.1 hypothetical protein K3U94_11290 [Mycolicibacter heraklionensis]
MKMLALQGVLLMAGAELVAVITHQHQLLLWAAAIAVALPLVGIRRLLTTGGSAPPAAPVAIDEPGEAIRQWLTGTEARIRWAESTRADWDRRWRPILARRFETSTGRGRTKDPAAFDATGALLFGDELWPWVDPGNVAPTGDRGPGPGRAVLEEILCRLEQR